MNAARSKPITFDWIKATAITVVAVIGAASATFGVVKIWLDDRYVNMGEFDKLAAKIKQMDRQGAGVMTTLLENQVIVARNRVNDCNVARADRHHTMSTMEIAACAQYDAELVEKTRRYQQAVTDAQKTWREQ